MTRLRCLIIGHDWSGPAKYRLGLCNDCGEDIDTASHWHISRIHPWAVVLDWLRAGRRAS